MQNRPIKCHYVLHLSHSRRSICLQFTLVMWHGWLGDRKAIWPMKEPMLLTLLERVEEGNWLWFPRRKAIRTWWCGAGGWHPICFCSFFWVVLLHCKVTHDLTFWTCSSLLPRQTTAHCRWSLHTRVSDWTAATWSFSQAQDQVHLMIPAWLHSHEWQEQVWLHRM